MNSIDNHKTKNKPTQAMLTCLRPRLLSMAVASCLASMSAMVAMPEAQASDIEIYQGATAGKPTVVLMLDTSNSMSGSKLTTLKGAVNALLDDSELWGNINIGMGSYPTSLHGPIKTGSMLVEANLLDLNHKRKFDSYLGSRMKAQGTTPAAQAYAEAGAYLMGTNTSNKYSDEPFYYDYQGFKYSSVPKTNGHYEAPRVNSCAGQAIYFLTDGQPNSSSTEVAKTLMDSALTPNTGSAKLSTDCSKYSYLGGESDSGWSCMLDFADKLLDKNNPKGVPIKTAAVGFGNAYNSLKSAKTLEDCNKASGDVKRLCILGIKGQGGFYYAKTQDDIVNSIKSLISKINTDIQPVSTGSISVPLDSLGNFQSRNFAYLPILDPKPGDSSVWGGNLKKYKVVNATIKGGNGNFVFKDTLGQFAEDTYDLWNKESTERPDKAKPQFGGTYQNVFKKTATRNLFVNNSGRLINLKVNSQVPDNFGQLSGYSADEQRALLHFMGYNIPDTEEIKDGKALSSKQDKTLKNIGGVLHSLPQLITTTVDIDEKTGSFKPTIKDSSGEDVSTREDYLLYGSMDGALHMIDDKTGQETFTFVPKQITELQPAALKGKGTTVNGSLPYGVDGPWETYVSYDLDINSYKYKASQIFAMGGLRMGGSTYYALDITDVTTPKLIYSVGSNYANRLQGDSTELQGITNDTIGKNAEQQAWSRMGQTWAKPTIGYVKSGGKRVMVNFLPGGYDVCYEDPQFKLNSSANAKAECNNKASAQGNAMYMIQVGEVESDKQSGSKEVKTDNSGKLLWWASNVGASNTDKGNTSRSNNLQYSKQADLKHSIVTQVRTVDRNYDGFTDHIYFADLGGQVWRADINNNKDTENFKVDRVVKILDVSDQVAGSDAPPRFYERPMVTFYNGNYSYQEGSTHGKHSGVMALVTVGSGDRSSPVKAVRSKPDALYSIIDKDLTRKDLFVYNDSTADITLRTSGVKTSNLAELTFTKADANAANGIQAKMQSNAAQGWYMPLTHWNGNEAKTSDEKYQLKMFNEPDALAGVLMLSTYNPDTGNTAGECSAGVIGQTQRERTCLPYGVCVDADGNAATARNQTIAGAGIADNFITQYGNSSVFTSIKNRREDNDVPKVICSGGNCPDEKKVKIDPNCKDGENCKTFDFCEGAGCGTDDGANTDQRINPLAWMEHQQ